jgi:hypothetical protein
MATALKLETQVQCEHAAFVPYEKDGDIEDDTMTTNGRCPSCNRWFALWTSNRTGEILAERELVSGEIRALRERYDQ